MGDGNVVVNVRDRASLMAAVARRLRARQGFAIATLNLDHLVKLRRDAAFRQAYAAQDFVTADGNPVVWLSRMAGRPVGLVTGADLVVPLVREAAAAGAPVALIGTTPDALARAGEALVRQAPGLEIAVRISPPMGFEPDGPAAERVLAEARESGARLALLALGAPRQERLAALGRHLAPEMGFASIGAGLDFLAGAQRRAPAWVRALAMEWLWRMSTNPARLAGRYAASALALPGLAARALWRRVS
ncbi:bacterial polymer biosynthesis protein, WecB/TagA/CpsF family [Wenxinia marina DSM 24838]|uniref:Bacterial polymer biosynthesis protein, WecB/TagA/CpsF family n=1 Tax=Wenxinia marina DSM 24838 TaxID=1123501 RepID=A0A0D0NRN6_9RHOB|nr:bacterial polymer biosynthesis protein, WecB/TagA/CpsF family [Wenxinia marina DSM 24838]